MECLLECCRKGRSKHWLPDRPGPGDKALERLTSVHVRNQIGSIFRLRKNGDRFHDLEFLGFAEISEVDQVVEVANPLHTRSPRVRLTATHAEGIWLTLIVAS